MATAAQAAANLANSLKSTGPKTAAGKARSSQNVYQHGLRSERIDAADVNACQGFVPAGCTDLLVWPFRARRNWGFAFIGWWMKPLAEELVPGGGSASLVNVQKDLKVRK